MFETFNCFNIYKNKKIINLFLINYYTINLYFNNFIMKYIKHFQEHSLYEEYLIDSEFPKTINKYVVSFCKQQRDIHYDKYIPHYNVLDILYANAAGEKKVDSTVLDPNLGYIPIGICVAETGFFGETQLARFMSLKYMSRFSPESGTLNFLTSGGKMGNADGIQEGGNAYKNASGFTANLQSDWTSPTENIAPLLFDSNGKWNLSELGEVNMYALTNIRGKEDSEIYLSAIIERYPDWNTVTEYENNDSYIGCVGICKRYYTLGTQPGDWYLPASGELAIPCVLKTSLNNKLSLLSSVYSNYCISTISYENYNADYHTTTKYNNGGNYFVNFNYGIVKNLNKADSRVCIAFLQY